MKKNTNRRARRKMEPASSKDETKEQRFFGVAPEAPFFRPAADVQLQVESPEQEEQVQRQEEEERENGDSAVQAAPEAGQEGL